MPTLEVAAGIERSEESLMQTAVDLALLGIEASQVEQRQVGFWIEEKPTDGEAVTVPAQVELPPDGAGNSILTWLAPAALESPRRVELRITGREEGEVPPFPAVQVLPDVNDRVWVRYRGRDLLGYYHGSSYRKPFFYPVNGPAGSSLTRLGHPRDFSGGHDHHRSLWIEHEIVNDVSFETEHLHFFAGTDSTLVGIGRIAHRGFSIQEDGPVYARLEMALEWMNHEETALLREKRCLRVYPLAGGEQLIDFDLTFEPQVEQVTFGQSTFGILAARVAHSLEVMRGGGRILNARGALNEAGVHRQQAEWCDYSGPISETETNGIAILSHPENLHFPNVWHVRDDGWMCASPFARHAKTINEDETLHFRFRVYVHDGDDDARIAARYEEFARPPTVTLSTESQG